MIITKPGDHFYTRSSAFLGKAIRVCTRTLGEKRTLVNHVGTVVQGGPIDECVVVEAPVTVQKHRLWYRYGPPCTDKVAIYRYKNLTFEQQGLMVDKMLSYVGKDYGYLKLVTHALDWFLQGAYVFRRLTVSDNYPICSWASAHSDEKVGITFGVDANAANPDDMWDYTLKHPEEWECIMPLQRLA